MKCGDVVYFEKINQKVTVRTVLSNGILCDWFDEKNQLHREVVNVQDLEFVSS
jgi:hypothetical protein